MQEPVDKTTWAKKLETGLEAITFLEINDPTNVINEAVDNLFKNMGENKSACEAEIENIRIDAYRDVALARLRYNQVERFSAIIPYEFMYPLDEEDEISSTEDFDSNVFQLWSNVNTSLLGLEEAMTYLRDDIATAIRQRVEMPDFADEFQKWMDRTNEELHVRANEGKRPGNFDDAISNAIQSGAASWVIFLFVLAALLAPLVSMCTQQ